MMRRGDVYLADLSPVVGSEQGGTRPVLVIQNNKGNTYSPTVIVAPITGKVGKSKIPTHVLIKSDMLESDSVVLLEQIRTIDKERLIRELATLDEFTMKSVDIAIQVSLGLVC